MSKLRQRQRNLSAKADQVTDCVLLPAHTTSSEWEYTQFVRGLIGSEACRVSSRGDIQLYTIYGKQEPFGIIS